MKRTLAISFLIFLTFVGFGQDAHFTQFYAAPTYLNPAFVGTSVQSRITANYRNQWTAIPGAFVNYNFAFDHYSPKINSGFGLLASYDKAGSGGLGNASISAQYGYEMRVATGLFIRPALQFTYTNRQIDFTKLIFTDQQIRGKGVTTLEENIFEPVNYFDVSTGFLITSPRLWAGASVHHINEPNESLYASSITGLARKISAHAGYRFLFKKKMSKRRYNMVMAFNYKQQAEFEQLDLGAYYEMNPFTFGIWYRGIPVRGANYGYVNHDAVAVILGFQQGGYKIGYSYDITISTLGVGSSAGSHEISLIYEWATTINKRMARRRIIPCAKF